MKIQAMLPKESGVALHHKRIKALRKGDNVRVILHGDGMGIKKTPAVVKFEYAGRRKPGKGIFYLGRNGTDRNRLVGSMFPEISHQAGKRAFPVSQQKSACLCYDSRRVALLFIEIAIGNIWVHRGFAAPL